MPATSPLPTLDEVLDDMKNESPQETDAAWFLIAMDALRKTWDTPEEDAAWAHLADLPRVI